MKNSISEMRPQLISEWSKKNYPIMPDEVPYGSNKQYWWIGPVGTNGRPVQKQDRLERSVPFVQILESYLE